ncbi:Bug family tripartite tricarboxylate transporter substrate binding protein [Advenella sp. FME57]|uniref:Bug family tripartite tricarboxylate transporter substrate binding protein n=1 Tax=Advenella sp. FME57 TaxID=2742604 RepID=UPI00351C6782
MLKRTIATIIATAIFGIAPGLASAAYPDQPIRLIVPFAPGGSTDILGRLLAEAMRPVLGQVIVVENKPGAGGNIGGHFLSPRQSRMAIRSFWQQRAQRSSIPACTKR